MRILRIVFSLFLLAFASSALAQVKLTFWSHWAAEKIKRDFVEDAIKRFEAANPGVKIEAQWYEKTALYAALKTALRAGTAPDIFYAEPDQVEYMENGAAARPVVAELAGIEPWAKEIWSYKGKPYGLPLEASTVELYYNKKLMSGPRRQSACEPAARFRGDDRSVQKVARQEHDADGARRRRSSVSRRLSGAGIDAEEARHRRNTTTCSKASCRGPTRASLDTLRMIRSWTEAGMLPTTFTTLKLGEAHTYFHTNPGAVMMLIGSWYTSRAFNPPDQGGPADEFPARHHEVSGDPGCGVQRVPNAFGAAAAMSPMPPPSIPSKRSHS